MANHAMRFVFGVIGLAVAAAGAWQVYRGIGEMQGPRELEQLKTAGTALHQAVQQAATSNTTPPMLSDPATAPRVRAAFDRDLLARAQGGRPTAWSDACRGSLTAILAYLNFGSGSATAPASQEANLRRFENEIIAGNDFALDCMARTITSLEAEITRRRPSANDTTRQGLQRTRDGIAQMVTGAVTSQTDAISAANRTRLLAAADRNADVFSRALDAPHRASVVAGIDQVLQTPDLDAGAAAALQRIRTRMSRTDCTGLCSL
jgi:hypothetical protein